MERIVSPVMSIINPFIFFFMTNNNLQGMTIRKIFRDRSQKSFRKCCNSHDGLNFRVDDTKGMMKNLEMVLYLI